MAALLKDGLAEVRDLLSPSPTRESHHRREKSIQLSVLHPQGSSLLFPHSLGENVPLDETQG